MTRWNIRTIALYSHDGRRRDINLIPGSVNIITGPSHTGKSAIAEIIDYCMGSGECHLPGIVRDKTSWVGLLWERDEEQMAIARPVPTGAQNKVDELFWDKGRRGHTLLPPTSEELRALSPRDAVMRQIEQAFGIGEVLTETLNPERPGKRITARQVIPFMLLDDDVIISKNYLLRGLHDQRRQQIIDALPYFLGVADEKMAAIESEFRRLQKELRAEERRERELKALVAEESDRAASLIAEAVQVGLLDQPPLNASLKNLLSLLAKARDWVPGSTPQVENNQLTELYAAETNARASIAKIRSNIAASERLLGTATEFTSVAQDQARKLAAIELLANPADEAICPICNSKVDAIMPTASSIRAAITALSGELHDVSRERPQIDNYVVQQRDELQNQQDQLRVIREQIKALVNEADAADALLELDHRRSRVVGRLSLYLESNQQLETAPSSRQDELRASIAALEEIIDIEAKKEQLNIQEQRISAMATSIMRELPFETTYRSGDVFFLSRTINCGVGIGKRLIYLRDIGSDENYLTLHIAVLTAMQRFFKQRTAPVPGLLLLDQISRPYFPPEKRPEEILLQNDTEAGALKEYFRFLFKETKEQQDLQIIILEHAYWSSDKDFITAVRERWSETEKLIPNDWPEHNQSTEMP